MHFRTRQITIVRVPLSSGLRSSGRDTPCQSSMHTWLSLKRSSLDYWFVLGPRPRHTWQWLCIHKHPCNLAHSTHQHPQLCFGCNRLPCPISCTVPPSHISPAHSCPENVFNYFVRQVQPDLQSLQKCLKCTPGKELNLCLLEPRDSQTCHL